MIYPNLLGSAALIPLRSQFLWMDLGQPERLFIPGIPWGIPILTVLVVISTYVQSKMMTPPSNGGPDDQAAMMSGMMNIYMPLFMGFICYSYASGLAVYLLATNLFSIGQYAAMGRLNWRNLLPNGNKSTKSATPAAAAKPVTVINAKSSKPKTSAVKQGKKKAD